MADPKLAQHNSANLSLKITKGRLEDPVLRVSLFYLCVYAQYTAKASRYVGKVRWKGLDSLARFSAG
jgi:hypothetical protein